MSSAAASPPTLSSEEQEQIIQTIEMFEVITQANPQDCQSLDILKDAYQRVGKQQEALTVARKLADTYVELGQYSAAMLEYEGILQKDADNAEVMAALGEVEEKLQKSGQLKPQAQAPTAPSIPAPGGSLGGGINLDFRSVISEGGTLMTTAATLRLPDSGSGMRLATPADHINLSLTDDGNAPLAKFLIQHRLVTEEVVSSALERVTKKNKDLAPNVLATSLIDEICRRGALEMDVLLSGILERSKFAYIPLEYYDVDRSIVKMLPESLTMGRLMVPFDILSRTVMIATANPFDALGKEAAQQLLDYNVHWHLASPHAIFKALGEVDPQQMSIKSFGERIADVLIEDGLLLPSQLAEAMDLQKKQGGRLLKLLTDKQYVTEQDMVISMGRCLDVPPINLSKVRVPEEVADLVPKDMARQYKLAPVCRLGNKLFVAMADPLNVLALDDLRQRTKLEIVPMITTERSVVEALSGVGNASSQMDQVLKDAAQDAANVEEVKQNREEIDLDRLAVESEDAPVVKIVNLILVQALKEKASDIHLEPFEKQFKLRYRVDGSLIEASSPPKALQLPIASRIKILAGLDIAERRLPQDGRFRIRVSGKEVDLRISILPTVYGEKIVIRLLDKGALSGSIDQLGMDEYTLGTFKKAVDAPHGMILVTGPTGSGKTTTLYSVLSELNSPEYNIVTVEDPIEYQLAGINQVAVKADIGLSFSDALRSILRQDPDIVMIGEIRDNETADIAVKAALTGHQVLSTLHTNDAAGAITRLDDMGIEPFLISSSILLTCAQRLVRRVCPNCREEFQPEPELLAKLDIQDDGTTFYHGAGCDRCKRRGYMGRAAIIEVLPVSETIRRLIIKRASAAVIKNQAVSEGMKTLRMVGIDKAREGITTLEEILRVTAEDH